MDFDHFPPDFVPGCLTARVRQARAIVQNCHDREERSGFKIREKEFVYIRLTQSYLEYYCRWFFTDSSNPSRQNTPAYYWDIMQSWNPMHSGIRRETLDQNKMDIAAIIRRGGRVMLPLGFEVKDPWHLKTRARIHKVHQSLYARIADLRLDLVEPRTDDGAPFPMVLVSQIGSLYRAFMAIDIGNDPILIDVFHPGKTIDDLDPDLYDRDINNLNDELPKIIAACHREVLNMPPDMRFPRYNGPFA